MDNVYIELIPLELITSNRDAIRKARKAFLISKGKTLEPFGLNRRDEISYIYLFVSDLVHVKLFSIFVNQSCHIFPLVSLKNL